LRDDQCELFVLDGHGFVEGYCLGYKFKVLLEEVGCEHAGEIAREFVAFLSYGCGTWKQLLRLSATSATSGT
jgi:hypothetical protein